MDNLKKISAKSNKNEVNSSTNVERFTSYTNRRINKEYTK